MTPGRAMSAPVASSAVESQRPMSPAAISVTSPVTISRESGTYGGEIVAVRGSTLARGAEGAVNSQLPPDRRQKEHGNDHQNGQSSESAAAPGSRPAWSFAGLLRDVTVAEDSPRRLGIHDSST